MQLYFIVVSEVISFNRQESRVTPESQKLEGAYPVLSLPPKFQYKGLHTHLHSKSLCIKRSSRWRRQTRHRSPDFSCWMVQQKWPHWPSLLLITPTACTAQRPLGLWRVSISEKPVSIQPWGRGCTVYIFAKSLISKCCCLLNKHSCIMKHTIHSASKVGTWVPDWAKRIFPLWELPSSSPARRSPERTVSQ